MDGSRTGHRAAAAPLLDRKGQGQRRATPYRRCSSTLSRRSGRPGSRSQPPHGDGRGLGLLLCERSNHWRCDRAVYVSRQRDELELAYEFLPSAWGQGFATEACEALLEWSWSSLPDSSIIAVTQTANAASRRVLQRLGFSEERTFTEWGAEQVQARLQRRSPDRGPSRPPNACGQN